MKKILLADDHPIMRDAYKMLLRKKYKKIKFGETGDTAQTIETALAQPWDMILLDLSMPGGGGLDALKVIHAERPTTPVLVVSTYEHRQYVLNSFRAGAMGYLNKGNAGPELANAIEQILAGGWYIDPKSVDYLVDVARFQSVRSPEKKLSNREKEVMQGLVSDRDMGEVSREMNLSVNTFRTYRKRIFDKLWVSSDSELMYCAFKNLLET